MWEMIFIWLVMFAPAFFWGGCPCCGVSCFECDAGTAMSECWEITVAGIVNDRCTLCGNINGTWTIQNAPDTECSFTGSLVSYFYYIFFPSFSCFSSTGSWVMYRDAGNARWTLDFGISTVRYVLNDVSGTPQFDCDGPNTFSLQFSGGACASFPSTITATPVVCP